MDEVDGYYLQLAENFDDFGRMTPTAVENNEEEHSVLFSPFVQVVEYLTPCEISRSPTKTLEGQFESYVMRTIDHENLQAQRKETLVQTSNVYTNQLNCNDAEKELAQLKKLMYAQKHKKLRDDTTMGIRQSFDRKDLDKQVNFEFYRRQSLSVDPENGKYKKARNYRIPVPCFSRPSKDQQQPMRCNVRVPRFKSQSLDFCLQRNCSLPQLRGKIQNKGLSLSLSTRRHKVANIRSTKGLAKRRVRAHHEKNLSADMALEDNSSWKHRRYRYNRRSSSHILQKRPRKATKKSILNAYADSGLKHFS